MPYPPRPIWTGLAGSRGCAAYAFWAAASIAGVAGSTDIPTLSTGPSGLALRAN